MRYSMDELQRRGWVGRSLRGDGFGGAGQRTLASKKLAPNVGAVVVVADRDEFTDATPVSITTVSDGRRLVTGSTLGKVLSGWIPRSEQ